MQGVNLVTAFRLIGDLRDALVSVDLDALNANIQVGGIDVSAGNPVPVSRDGSSPPETATATNQITMITALQLIDDLRNALGSVAVDELRVVNNPISAFDHGSNSTVGITAVQLTAASIPATVGVKVKAAEGNRSNIYIGNSDVTAASADETDGMELGPGESILVRVDDVSKIYAIAAAGKKPKAQRVFWLVV